MGTRFNLLLPGVDDLNGNEFFSKCIRELTRLENMLSCFVPSSEVSMLNQNAYQKSQNVSLELYEIIASCQTFFNQTQGMFDIGIGKIIDYWKGEFTEADLDELTSESGTQNIELDPQKKTVRFTKQHVKLNLGGYGKGYALDTIRQILIGQGVQSAYFSFGESSISTIGTHPHGEYWPVGIQNFYQKEKCLKTFKLVGQSVSTSGNLETANYIIDPRNGKPVEKKKMVTVKTKSAVDAEVLSTTLLVAEESEKTKIEQAFPESETIEKAFTMQMDKTAPIAFD